MDFGVYQQLTETYLDRVLPKADSPTKLAAAMRYATLNAGKRMRPCLVYATGNMLGVPEELLHAPAASVELIHCYTLIHDDLPAMDDDDLRRGKPSCHKAFDECTAILAGDALQALAFEVLSDPKLNPIAATQRCKQINILAQAVGGSGLVLGQAQDIAAENQSMGLHDLAEIHQRKTGALFKACVQLALQASDLHSDSNTTDNLHHYAENLGLLFQIQDDILDVIGSEEDLGKTIGKDQATAKSSYTNILGLELAKQHAQAALQASLDAISCFGNSARNLAYIANLSCNRKS